MSLGKNLKKLRNKRGLSQYDVAEKLGIKRGRYNTWENDIAKPRFEMLEKLCEFYNVSMNDLTGKSDHVVEHSNSNKVNENGSRYVLRLESDEDHLTENELNELQKDLEAYFKMRKQRIIDERNDK